MSYKCPICGNAYDTADGLMKCVNACGAKAKATEEAAAKAKIEAKKGIKETSLLKKQKEIKTNLEALKTLIFSYNEEAQKFNAAYRESYPTYDISFNQKIETTYKLNFDNLNKKDYDNLLGNPTNRLSALADDCKAKSNADKTAEAKTSTVRKKGDKPTAYIFGLDDTESLDDLIMNIFGF